MEGKGDEGREVGEQGGSEQVGGAMRVYLSFRAHLIVDYRTSLPAACRRPQRPNYLFPPSSGHTVGAARAPTISGMAESCRSCIPPSRLTLSSAPPTPRPAPPQSPPAPPWTRRPQRAAGENPLGAAREVVSRASLQQLEVERRDFAECSSGPWSSARRCGRAAGRRGSLGRHHAACRRRRRSG